MLYGDNDENRKNLNLPKSFHLEETGCNQSYRRSLRMQETKTGIIISFRNAGNVKSNLR